MDALRETLLVAVRGAGKILLKYFGRVSHPRLKEAQSSVVCDADLAAERFILAAIRARFPDHNSVAEESGVTWKGSKWTWVIDPLDGTSNFVAGLPWFGVQVAVLCANRPLLAAMHLPIDDVLYFSQKGGGARRNQKRVSVTKEGRLHNVLCAFGFDPAPARRSRGRVGLLFRVSQAVRNTRTTNSLVDFCYTIDGRFGACINLKTKIWDIVPASLILPEAGGRLTYLSGEEISFQIDSKTMDREYAILAGSRHLHQEMLKVLR